MKKKKGRNTNKAVNILLDILIGFFGIVLLVTIYNWVQLKILGNDYSSFFGYSLFEVQTNSMADAINAGDWIIVKYDKDIQLDDIVTFKEDGEFITHRVVNVYNGTYVTQGDANNTKDDEIDQEQIVGKVVKILPNFGIIRNTLFNPIVLLMIIVTVYLINITWRKKDSKRAEGVMSKLLEKIKSMFKKNDEFVFDDQEEKEVKVTNIQVHTYDEEKTELIPDINEIEMPTTSEEDLDKTVCFRMVSVKKDELEKVYKKKEVKEMLPDEPKPKKSKKVKEDEKVSDSLIEQELEMIQKRKKKFKNIIEKVMYIKEEEINQILDIINNNERLKTNEATIRDYILKTYIDGKYYNFCGNVNVEYNKKNMNVRMESVLEQTADYMKRKYKGTDTKFSEKVDKYFNYFNLVLRLESDFNDEENIDDRREIYAKRFKKYLGNETLNDELIALMINDIIKCQKLHKGMIKATLAKVETSMFELIYNKIPNTNLYGLELTHNIKFSQIYSDYIIDKTYSDGIIAEDKIAVLLNILLAKMASDMIDIEFSKKYILYIPESLYLKDNKLDKIFGMFNDEFAKNNILVLIQYDKLINNKKTIRALIKDGYKFVTDMGNIDEIKEKDMSCVELMNYIFVNKDIKKSSLPKEFKEKIIYDDVASRIGNYWGE